MNPAQQSLLDRKLAMLHRAQATIQPTANVQSAGNKPWQVYAPGGAAQLAFPVLGANAILLCQYQVKPLQSGALTGLVTAAVASNFVDNSGAAVWHLTLNGAAVPGFEDILSQLGSFQNPLQTYVTLQDNDLVQLWVAGREPTTTRAKTKNRAAATARTATIAARTTGARRTPSGRTGGGKRGD